jgi:cation transport regulator
MPYQSTKDLPDRVKENLPAHAEEIYVAAFNNALADYKYPE